MPTTAKRSTTITYLGDVNGVETIAAADNIDVSPAVVELVTLAIGDNVIAAPGGGATPKACTIVKPAGNAVLIKLKGAGGDTGIALSKTDPDTISIDAGVASFILNAAAQLVGVRLFWT